MGGCIMRVRVTVCSRCGRMRVCLCETVQFCVCMRACVHVRACACVRAYV